MTDRSCVTNEYLSPIVKKECLAFLKDPRGNGTDRD